MNIPNLPTDNLYKFIALTGFFLMVFSFGYKEYRNHQFNIENTKINVAEKLLEFKIENKKTLVEHSRKLRDFELNVMESENNNMTKEELNKYIEKFISSYKTEISEAELEWYYNDAGELLKISELTNVYVGRTKKLNWILNLSIFIGLISMISGFYLWYIKLQKYQDIILLKKSQISRSKTEEEENEDN